MTPRLRIAVSPVVFALVLIAAVIAAYSNSLSGPLVLDDVTTIANNRSITRLWPLSNVLFPPADIYSAGRPLLNLSFALNHAIGGTSVRGYHLANLAIHLAAALTLLGVVHRGLHLPRFRARFGDAARMLAFAVAALWALHPVQTVSVTYVSQRAESLMGLFYLLTLYGFLRWTDNGHRGWAIVSVASCAAGMMTKEVMATAPIALFLLDWRFVAGSAREAWRRRATYHLLLAATWLPLAGLMLTSGLADRAVGQGHGLAWYDYARLECRALAHYLRVAFWPNPLIFDHGANLATPSLAETILKGSGVLGALLACGIGLWRGRAWGLLGFLCFLILAPTSSVMPVAGQPIAENRVYLPLASVVILAVTGLHLLMSRRAWIPLAATILLCGVMAHQRNAVYRDEIALWRDTTAKQPTNARAWVYLCLAVNSAGRQGEAIETLRTALRHLPSQPELHANLGVFLYMAGKIDEGLNHLQTAVRLNPRYIEGHYNLGIALFKSGHFAPALEAFTAYLRLRPANPEIENYAGVSSLRIGDIPRAIEHFQRALRLDPNHRVAAENLRHVQSLAR